VRRDFPIRQFRKGGYTFPEKSIPAGNEEGELVID